MFELETMTKVRVLDVRVLSKKDRKVGELPGAQLLLQATMGAGILAMFDGLLPGTLFRKPEAKAQGELDGVESAELTQIGKHVKRLGWVYEQTGCVVHIDYGTGGPSDIDLADCTVYRVNFQPQEGSAIVQWTVDAPALSDTMRGRLTGLKSTDIQMTQTAPVAGDDQINIEDLDDGDGELVDKPAPTRKPAAAERAAVAKVKGGKAPPMKYRDARTGETWSGRGLQPKWLKVALERGATLSDFDGSKVNRPFPKNGKIDTALPPHSATVEIERSQPGTRTARGREKTAAALAKGAQA